MPTTTLPRPSRFVIAFAICAAGVGSVMVLHAAPQDALGTGRGLEARSGSGRSLDRGLLVGSDGTNTPLMNEDFRARNLVVTGNVAGGWGFRGSVGYTAERDFRGNSSDNASYDFRAGSAFSDPRVIRAATMGDRLSMARRYGNIEYGRANTPDLLGGSDQIGARLRFDQSSSRLSAPEMQRSMSDISTAGVYDIADGGKARMLVGDFTGVRVSKDTDAVDALGLGLYDTARLKQDLRSGRIDKDLKDLRYQDPLRAGRASEIEDLGAGRVPSNRITDPGATRIDTGIKTMDDILRSLDRNLERDELDIDRARATGAAAVGAPAGDADAASSARRADFSRDLESLRREIRGGTPEPKKPDGTPGAADPLAKPEPLSEEAVAEAEQQAAKRRSLDDIAILLQHGQRIEQLSDTQVERIREIVALGETAMKRSAFFLAEQHFTTALTLNPGNPLAQAGVANAQMGAGLIASAAITLRDLFANHPELIDVRYAPELLPPSARMKELLERLGTTPTDARNAADVGLSIAYLGRQLEDPDAIDRGLAMMKGTPGDETMAKLLRGVWLGPKLADPVPSEAAPPAE